MKTLSADKENDIMTTCTHILFIISLKTIQTHTHTQTQKERENRWCMYVAKLVQAFASYLSVLLLASMRMAIIIVVNLCVEMEYVLVYLGPSSIVLGVTNASFYYCAAWTLVESMCILQIRMVRIRVFCVNTSTFCMHIAMVHGTGAS